MADTNLYERIKAHGDKAKAEADAFAQGLAKKYTKENPAPNEVIQKGLEEILAKYEHSEASHHIASHAAPATHSRTNYAIGLAGVAAALLMAAGLPPMYLPPLY